MTHGPELNVGIVSGEELRVNLATPYRLEGSNREPLEGDLTFRLSAAGRVEFEGKEYDGIELRPAASGNGARFEVKDVTIGVNFHWERKENQSFTGGLGIIVEDEPKRLTLVNRLPVEDYLKSVISSEMNATSSPELLKAHAVISRSWLFAQLAAAKAPKCKDGWTDTAEERIVWYDREDHKNFDVCADDHCQRYQGITRQTRPEVEEAIDATFGVVLKDAEGKVCDARFSKCCGGVFEKFESCWEPAPHPYLQALRDGENETDFPDLMDEDAAREWIAGSPEAYCNTRDERVLAEVLNSYDRETPDFYRWNVEYSREELSDLLRRRAGEDFGDVVEMKALERGTSGRIIRLLVRGTKKTKVIGKELEIRRSLSESHLYSSAFLAEGMDADEHGVARRWRLRGAGWGHGVGLCQIGAAMMAHEGKSWEAILGHYFPGAVLKKEY
ncbi:MAG: SpoIID/LytB domain-containing protein [Muribaculaceae bacterium]|nr:SpoIID/LytB domain-containing protein [Muribaculaceae bacterium]